MLRLSVESRLQRQWESSTPLSRGEGRWTGEEENPKIGSFSRLMFG